MIKFLFHISLLGLAITGNAQKFSGKIFTLGDSQENCKVYEACDCCTSELLFINETRFAIIDFCEYTRVITAGTYKVESGKLTLSFIQAAVTKGKEDYINVPESPYLRKDKGEVKPITFVISKCTNGSTMLQCKAYPNYGFGLRSNVNQENVADFANSDEWKMVNSQQPDEILSITIFPEKVFIEGVEFSKMNQKSEYGKVLAEEIKKRNQDGLATSDITFDMRVQRKINVAEKSSFEAYIKGLGAEKILYSVFE